MASARVLSSQLRLRYSGFLGVAAGVRLHDYAQRNQQVLNDAPVSAKLLRDHDGKAQEKTPIIKPTSQLSPSRRKEDSNISQKDEVGDTRSTQENGDESTWENFSRNISAFGESVTDMDWGGVGDRITNFILPTWARQIPDQLRKLQSEFSMEPGSLADDIWHEAANSDINPEIEWDARVRVSNDLCRDELEFRKKRRQRLVPALARYLDIDETEINPEDVPTIALCGSGGGLRALVAGTGSMLAAQEAGLFDCVTYTAGVSGSCWLQALYHTSLGHQNFHELAQHLKNRIDVHIAFPPPALKLICSAPTHKFLLSGFIEKLRGDPGGNFGLVDVYGLLLGARLMVPRGELGVSDRDLKLSNQRANLDRGGHPMPIYTAVRHEIPVEAAEPDPDTDSEAVKERVKEEVKEKAKKEAWFQWFEFTPYEVFCEEFSAGIPTWAVGRPFNNGRNVVPENGFCQPEIRLPLMLGLWGSAFCATLSHYYEEIQPALVGIAGFDGLDSLLSQNRDDLVKIHPIDPASIPNFIYGMQGSLPPSCPDSLYKKEHLELMDAGMSNNLPIYPLLRPGRDVDILVTFDASADKKKGNWLSMVDGYARQRGINGWPIGAGWPQLSSKPAEAAAALNEAQVSTVQEAADKVSDARDEANSQAPPKANDSNDNTDPTASSSSSSSSSSSPSSDDDLGYCTIWVGSKSERLASTEPPPSKRLEAHAPDSEASFHLMQPSAAMTVIYFPYLPNPTKVPHIDPDTSDFMSTWNFIYTPEQVDRAIALARANFDEGKEQTRRCVRAVYERKRSIRLKKEGKEKEEEEEYDEQLLGGWGHSGAGAGAGAGLRARWKREGDHFV